MNSLRTRTPSLLALVVAAAVVGCDEPPLAQTAGVHAACYDGEGLCIKPELIDEDQRELLDQDSCLPPLLCAPRSLLRGEIAPTCASIAEAEGRCLPERLSLVAAQRERLPVSSCAEGLRCVPCYDPFTAEATGACSLPGDPGPVKPPVQLGTCCAGGGRCLPAGMLGSEERAQLARDACAKDELCVPQFVLDDEAPDRCDSVNASEGRCLPVCLPAIGEQRDRLPGSTCAAAERCAPCFDPLSGEATGSCSLASDPGPRRPPETLGTCCGGGGRCLPDELVGSEQRDALAQRECPAEQLCAPKMFIEEQPPRACRSFGSSEGRCLPACLPLVEEQLDRLPRASCEQDERCVPCFDPLSGVATGACSLPEDPGPSEPAQPFESCCGGSSRCLPVELVPGDQREQLARAECASADLCVPEPLTRNEPPSTCASIGGAEGRCLPACMPVVEAEAERLPRSSCAEAERCVPCFDPFSGTATGACTLPADPGPSEPPRTLAECCEGTSRCVPSELVPDEQRAQLARAQCDAADLCVPAALTREESPTACGSIGGAEGRCLPVCMPVVAAEAERLPRSSCAEAERCVPCFDPFSGATTGACTLPADPGPSEPPRTLAECCEGTSRCVPSELVPSDQRSLLDRADCGERELCAPQALAAGEAALACESIGGAEGRCMSTCVPMVAAQAAQLPRSRCAEAERCVPCFDPFSGAATGSCSFPGDPGPQRPPVTFAECCVEEGRSHGRCVPPELVPEDKRELLAAAGCAGDALCLPNSLAPPATALPACRSEATGDPGACVPGCLLDESTRGITTQSTCPSGERCAPCEVLGTPTGVCDQVASPPPSGSSARPGASM